MQAAVTGAADQASLGTIHPLSTRVSGRDIFVSGVADSAEERDQILAAMHDVQGRRVVRDELRVLDTASPFALSAVKNAESYTYSGSIPTEADRSVLAAQIGAGADDLDLMAGSPDANWTGVVAKGLDGLGALEDGSLSVQGQDILVTGNALTPSEDAAARAALADLPNGYGASFDITVLDDGTPFRLTMDRAEDGTATASGKIPSTMDAASLSNAYGTDIKTDLQQGNLSPELADWSAVTQSGASALGKLRSGQLQMTETTLSLTGVADPDGKAAAEAMLASLPEGFSGSSDIALYDDGAPFSLEMTSDDTGTKANGKFPADVAASEIIGDTSAGEIVTAFIDDDTGSFAPVATAGVQALG